MGSGIKPGEKPQDYLLRRGWTFTSRRDPWEWHPPGLAGAGYTLEDALTLQAGADDIPPKTKKAKGE